jgi:hypothetical protein
MVALILLLSGWLASSQKLAAGPLLVPGRIDSSQVDAISPYWDYELQQIGDDIVAVSRAYGFHPDFIAAIVNQELIAQSQAEVHETTVGLMRAGLSSPESHAMLSPHIRWGMSVLSYVFQQSGGDLLTALTAYFGGWASSNSSVQGELVADVLDNYERAIMHASGISPELAGQWTIVIEVRTGNVPVEPVLYLGRSPYSVGRKFAQHSVYSYGNESGDVYDVRAYLTPVALDGAIVDELPGSGADSLEPQLREFLGDKSARGASGDPLVLLACLPTLERLRGLVVTRWYAPKGCPAAGR